MDFATEGLIPAVCALSLAACPAAFLVAISSGDNFGFLLSFLTAASTLSGVVCGDGTTDLEAKSVPTSFFATSPALPAAT